MGHVARCYKIFFHKDLNILKIGKRCHFLITWAIVKDLVIIVDVKGLIFDTCNFYLHAQVGLLGR
jgi:hypothetical protein